MSAEDRDLVNSHLEQLLILTKEKGVPEDLVGRLLVGAAIGIWKKSRSVKDIAAELEFTIENLDPDTEYPFIRP